MNARRILKGHVADKPRLLLVIQEEHASGNAADQMAALVGLEVAQRSHGTYYTIFPTSAPPLLLHYWGLVAPPFRRHFPMSTATYAVSIGNRHDDQAQSHRTKLVFTSRLLRLISRATKFHARHLQGRCKGVE